MDLDSEELEATRNKSADKMFEDLGYELITEEDYFLYYKPTNSNVFRKEVYFHIDIEGIQMFGCFTAKELKAINKKLEELGW